MRADSGEKSEVRKLGNKELRAGRRFVNSERVQSFLITANMRETRRSCPCLRKYVL